MTLRKRIISLALLIVMVITIGGEMILAFSVRASAEGAVSHSNVLDDLQRDESFNPEDYPADANDYSLQVIQVAEGSNGELFVYVYQPSDAVIDLRASYITMSLEKPQGKNPDYTRYKLTWLNSNGVFDKYIVDGFTVSDEAYRYYTISAIYRDFNEKADGENGEITIIEEKGYSVARSWCAYYYNDLLFYEVSDFDVFIANINHFLL